MTLVMDPSNKCRHYTVTTSAMCNIFNERCLPSSTTLLTNSPSTTPPPDSQSVRLASSSSALKDVKANDTPSFSLLYRCRWTVPSSWNQRIVRTAVVSVAFLPKLPGSPWCHAVTTSPVVCNFLGQLSMGFLIMGAAHLHTNYEQFKEMRPHPPWPRWWAHFA